MLSRLRHDPRDPAKRAISVETLHLAVLVRHDDGMGAVRIGRLVSAALDPVLVPAGFQGGQYGEGEGDAKIIFCAGHDEFSHRHPQLPQSRTEEPKGACVDLVVGVRSDCTLGDVDLEGISPEETLRHVGLVADGEAVATLHGRPVTEGLSVIETALRRLFGAPAS